MTLSHLRPEVPAPVAEPPYDVVLGTFHGDWRDAADIYRNWAARQWWCATPLRDRQDIPGFLKEGSAIVIGSVNATEARERLIGADLERLPELTAAYRARTGLPHIVFVPYGWENRGTWAGINYLPAVPSNEAWQRANAALRAQGDRTAFLTSGYWWVVKRQQTQNGPAFDDSEQFERRRDMVIHQADGTPFLVRNYDQLAEHGNWRGLSAALCRGSSQAADWMRGVFLDVARLGVPLISFDQDIGGGQVAPCYHPDHGHPPGYGNWMWTGFRDVCRDILEQGRTFAPELGLFLENVSELAIPWMATYWSRQFGEVDQGAIGARGVGLFSYLYHDYVTAIGAACVQGQGQQGTRPHPGLRRVVLANNLVRGLVPGPFITDVPLEPSSDWHREIAPAFFSYCRPYAHFPEYLLLGRTARPPRVTSADVPLWFHRQDPQGEPLRPGGPKVLKVPISLPAVVVGCFTAVDGSTATILANATPDEQEATVHADGTAAAMTLFDAERQPLRQWLAAPGEAISIVLEPLGTRVLVAVPRR